VQWDFQTFYIWGEMYNDVMSFQENSYDNFKVYGHLDLMWWIFNY
jgi:hypothetical protein